MVKENTARLSLKLLGGFELRDPSGESIRLPTRNAKALLAYLVVQAGQSQSRERLMALLWGERSDKQARHSLNQTLVHIRKAAAQSDDKILESDRDCIAVIPDSIDADVSKFQDLAARQPSQAMSLYGGPFLDGLGIRGAEFEGWLSARRSEFQALACRALKAQCERCVTQGRHAEAIEVGKRLVTLDPLCEEAHRQLMRLYDESGDRTSALKQYRSCVGVLERELEIGPAQETIWLFEEIKNRNKTSAVGKKGDDQHQQLGIDNAAAPTMANNPSIAVLPFEYIGGEAEQEYFSDGVTEDIITELSRYPDFLVIARNSTFVYKHRVVDHKQIAHDLGVQFLLEGSVRRAGDKVRVTAQLIDALKGNHVWAERYDRTLDDIFAVQDEITESIVSALGVTIEEARMRRDMGKDPSSLDAYEKTLQAWAHVRRYSRADNVEAQRLATEAVKLDPGYARGFTILAWTYLLDYTSHWAEDLDEALSRSHENARKAVMLDGHSFHAYRSLGMCETWLGRHDEAIANFRRAVELNPNDPDVRAYFANALVFAGCAEEALEQLETAKRLNPLYPESYLQFLGRAYFTQHRYEEAEAAFARVVTVNPGWPWAHLTLAATHAALGKVDEAKAAVAEARRLSPDITLAHAAKAWPFRNRADFDHLTEMLRVAGLQD